jgi:hypothetical protein
MSNGNITARVAYHISVYSFLLTLFTVLVSSIGVSITLYQYSVVKSSENAQIESKNKQQRMENVLKLLSILSTHEGGMFAELAAAKELENYPEYNSVYIAMLSVYNDYKSDPSGKILPEYIEAIRHLVAATAAGSK